MVKQTINRSFHGNIPGKERENHQFLLPEPRDFILHIGMKITLLLLFFTLNTRTMLAQNNNSSVTGDYYLNGVMETASGFRLNADSTFEFFFSQGALDRYGKGHYNRIEDSISFHSDLVHSSDFALISSKKQPGNSTIIKITDPNSQLLQYVFIRVKAGAVIKEGFADSKGYFKCDVDEPGSIELMFEFCPEKITTIPVPAEKHNYFEFKFEPWLFEYFFTGFRLQTGDSKLMGGHPLLKGTTFVYSKLQ